MGVSIVLDELISLKSLISSITILSHMKALSSTLLDWNSSLHKSITSWKVLDESLEFLESLEKYIIKVMN